MNSWSKILVAGACLASVTSACTIETTGDDEASDAGGNAGSGGNSATGGAGGGTSASGESGGSSSGSNTTGDSGGAGGSATGGSDTGGSGGVDAGGSAGVGGSAGSGGTGGTAGSGEQASGPGMEAPPDFVAPECGSEEALADVSSDLTLTAGNCYRVDGTLTVSDATLTIEPGVTIVMSEGAIVEVLGEGALVAVGTASEPITFTGSIEEPGHWRSVDILSQSPDNRLEHVQFAYGGSEARCCEGNREPTMVLVSEGRVSIKDSVFAFSAGNGLDVLDTSDLQEFSGNLFLNNEGAPVRIRAGLVGALDSGSNYLGDPATPNGHAFIEVQGSSIDDDATWPRTNLPFRSREGLEVGAATLTLSAGVSVQFDDDTGLSVGEEGTLVAVGDAETPIQLAGAVDEVGTWVGVIVTSNDRDNRLAFVEIANAGQSVWCCNGDREVAGLLLEHDARLGIEDTTFRDSGGYGLQALSGSVLEPFARNHFSGNAESAVLLSASSVAQLDSASTYLGDNVEDRVVVLANTVTEPGTWPALDVPYLFLDEATIDADISVAPGARLSFDADAGLWVGVEGSLSAISDEGDIRFEGRVDQAGYWKGIGLESASELNVFDGVTIDGAGSASWCCEGSRDPAAILLDPSSQVSVTNSTLSRSSGWGIFAVSDALSVTESDNTFEDNVLGNVHAPE